MPFITQEERDLIDNWGLTPTKPGDRCYVFYKEMVDKWKENPRWTTAHEIYKGVLQMERPEVRMGVVPYEVGDWEEYTAMHLAWQVFFQLYVMPYELEKRKENGDI